jgi:hypothetical protein
MKSDAIKAIEREMTEEQIMMDRAKANGAWESYGKAKLRFAGLWDELNRVKAQQLEKD